MKIRAGRGSRKIRERQQIIADTLRKIPANSSGGGAATQLDADGTILDVNTIADGEVLKRVGLTIVSAPVGAPGAHAATHQNGGTDEINVAGLSGVLADPQTPNLTAHLADADPHPQYNTQAEGDARYGRLGGANNWSIGLNQFTKDSEVIRIRAATVSAALWYSYYNSVGARRGYIGFSVIGTSELRVVNEEDGPVQIYANNQLRITANGSAGGGSLHGNWNTTGAHTVGGVAVVLTNDARLSDARTPLAHSHILADLPAALITDVELATELANYADTSHATTHQSGGTDPIKLDDLVAPDDNTDLNASTVRHGLLPKLSGVATDVLLGTGAFGSVPGGGGGFTWIAVVKQAADVTTALAAFTDTDLIFNFLANSVYIIDLYLMCTSVATTSGYRFAFDTSVAVTATALHFAHQLAAAGTVSGGDSNADATARGLSSGVPVANGLNMVMASGILVTGANPGTCRLVFGGEVAASVTFKANSIMRVHKAV